MALGPGAGAVRQSWGTCAGVGCLLAPPQRLGGGCASEEARCSPPNPGVCAGSTLLGRGRWWAAGSHRTTLLCGQPCFPVGMGSSDGRGGCSPLAARAGPPFTSAFEQLPCCCDSQPGVQVHSNLCLLLFLAILIYTPCMAPCKVASSMARQAVNFGSPGLTSCGQASLSSGSSGALQASARAVQLVLGSVGWKASPVQIWRWKRLVCQKNGIYYTTKMLHFSSKISRNQFWIELPFPSDHLLMDSQSSESPYTYGGELTTRNGSRVCWVPSRGFCIGNG